MIQNRNVMMFLVLLAAVGCGPPDEPATTGERPVAAELVTARLETAPGLYEVSGTVEAGQRAVLSSRVPGYVRELRVRAGDRVTAGELLVLLEGEDLRARYRAAEAALSETEEAAVEAESALEAAEARASVAEATFERFRALEEKRAVTAQEMDEVEGRHRAAQAERQAARARLRRVRSTLERVRAELAAAEAVWGHTRVRAPFDGRVIERHVDVGNLATPGTPLLVVEQKGPSTVLVSVDESRSGAIRRDDPATVRLDEGETVAARVIEVSPAVDRRSRAFVVRLELPPDLDPERYPPGRFVRVSFRAGGSERLLIPETAVLRRGQLELVYVVEQDRARLRLVTLGRAEKDRVEVLSGLQAGETIVRRAAEIDKDGRRVGRSS